MPKPDLKDIIKILPNKPGVYQYFDKSGKLLYIGKAKDLKNRVSSYFTKSHQSHKVKIMVTQITDIKHVVVESETDALLLENNLVKKHQPKYNVMLRDDKTFPWICVKNERFPRVFKTRTVINDGSKYYGPYTSVVMVNTILDFIRQIYKIRTCKHKLSEENIKADKFKVCLEYHIGNCLAPCVGEQEEKDYNIQIEQIHHILKGNIQSVIESLKEKMKEFAAEQKFEDAQNIKEKLEQVDSFKSKSTIVNPSINNVDVFSLVEDESAAYINFLKVVSGAIIQAHTVEIKKVLDEKKEELLLHSIVQIRERMHSNSTELILPFKVDLDLPGTKQIIPKIGDKKKLLDLSKRNALYFKNEKKKLKEIALEKTPSKRKLEIIMNDLKMKELPHHIECFDNSNIQGANPVASCVVFKDARPAKKEYRHYHIKSVKGPDDFASMEEVVYRRYKRLMDEEKPLPQLIIIDGGKGQLSSAVKSLKDLNILGRLTIIGIAKKLEEIYFPNDQIPLYLDKRSETLIIIQQIRNEAHRFGINFHRSRRDAGLIKPELLEIEGIGEKTMELLLKKYRSLARIKQLSEDELTETVGRSKAKKIIQHFDNKGRK